MALINRLKGSQAAPSQARAVVAAATTISQAQLKSLTRTSGTAESWQDEAWQHYDLCGEFRFAAGWIGNVLSRVRLFPAYIDDSEDEPVALEEGRAAEILADLHGGGGGQSQMLRRLGVHLSVPGESFVVTWRDSPGAPQHWATLCGDEITEKAGAVVIRVDGEDIELPEQHQIIRIWRPHPRYHWDADSPGRGLLPVLRELERLSARVVAQIESRLAGAGLLFLPDNMTFPIQDDDGSVRKGTSVTEFMQVLARAMITPIGDRDSAAAVVPILAQAPAESIEAIRHISLATELDAQTQELREGALRRLALGVDMPPEILLGLGGTNHWSAWEIGEAAVTQHVEPLMGVITDGLAASYFRPALAADNIPDVDRYVIAFDTAELVNRPNRGPDAILLYDRGEINGAALRREHGFSDADAFTAAERRQRDLRELVSQAALNSETANRLMELLGYVQPGQIPIGPTEDGPAQNTGPALPATQPTPEPRSIPARPAAALEGPALIAVQAVAQYAAASALEYAGKRLLACDRSFRGRFKDVPHHELHTHIPVTRNGQFRAGLMLDGAFRTFDQLPELAPVRDVVARHVEWLLIQGLPIDRAHLNEEVRVAFNGTPP